MIADLILQTAGLPGRLVVTGLTEHVANISVHTPVSDARSATGTWDGRLAAKLESMLRQQVNWFKIAEP